MIKWFSIAAVDPGLVLYNELQKISEQIQSKNNLVWNFKLREKRMKSPKRESERKEDNSGSVWSNRWRSQSIDRSP